MAVKRNRESDFKIKEIFRNSTCAKFVYEFYTNKRGNKYIASWDGETYKNCKKDGDGNLIIIFNDTRLEVGKLKVKRKYSFTDVDFPDGFLDRVYVNTLNIEIVETSDEGDIIEEPEGPGEGEGDPILVDFSDSDFNANDFK